jgi:hypothetical protein
MNTNNAELIGEEQAAVQARVSTSTLARFAEAGYFQVVLMGEERCYPKQALSTVFGVTFKAHEVEPEPVKKATIIAFPQTDAVAQHSTTTTNSVDEKAAFQTDTTTRTEAALDSQTIANSSDSASAHLENDLSFKTILRMHADILERQEREIQDLRTEREWLKKRIERLEDKAERDQILLLSEAQTVKQLIQLQAQRKSYLRQSLEWLGVVPQEISEHENMLTGKLVSTDSTSEKKDKS